jgi:hypothetical protein
LVAAVKGGFEMIDLPMLGTQSLLDLTDPSLKFAQKKTKPMAIFRVSDIFLVCYDSSHLFFVAFIDAECMNRIRILH